MEQTRVRADIKNDIYKKRELIRQLQSEIVALRIEHILLCDEDQWFEEKKEEVVLSMRPKRKEKRLVGRVHWRESFKDEGTGDLTWIERSEIVRVNGEWLLPVSIE